MMLPLCSPSVSGRFAWIVEALIGCVAPRLAGVLPEGEVAVPLAVGFVIAVHNRLAALARRFARLVEQARDGTLPQPRPRRSLAADPFEGVLPGVAASGPVLRDAASADAASLALALGDAAASAAPLAQGALYTPPSRLTLRDLPPGFGWFIRLRVPGGAAYAAHLRDLLQDADMVALASSHPAFGRVLRPLCHMLAIAPHPDLVLLPPPVPASARLRRPRTRPRGPTLPWTRPRPHCDGLPGRDPGATRRPGAKTG